VGTATIVLWCPKTAQFEAVCMNGYGQARRSDVRKKCTLVSISIDAIGDKLAASIADRR
jgi:hypothetical protein